MSKKGPRRWIMDWSPLRTNPDYRKLFLGQLISTFGTAITQVSVPYQIYQLTHSTAVVGLLGITQLVPLSLSGLWGGNFADRHHRGKIVIVSESLLALCSLLFLYSAVRGSVPVGVLFGIAAAASFLNGFHRPALEAIQPKILKSNEIAAVSALNGFRGTFATIMGPGVAGILIASFGLSWGYGIDALSYLAGIFSILSIRNREALQAPPANQGEENSLSSGFLDGLKYASSRPLLLGTYLVDICSMTLAYPSPLFPALAEFYGGPRALGALHAAPSIGAFLASVTSGWTGPVRRHGKTITLAAAGWCLGVLGVGLTTRLWPHLWVCVAALAFAGFSDMVSAIFRSTVWNSTIPDQVRGRMAGVEMLSYMTGPLIGGTLMGTAASVLGIATALSLGGAVGIGAVFAMGRGLKEFWAYSTPSKPNSFKVS